MKLLGFFSCLALCASGALGSLAAGPYQTVAMWYAYRMDVQAYGHGNTEIARGCKGSLADRSCTFNEFLRRITRKWHGTISISDTDLDPDVENAVQALRNSGYDYTVNQDRFLPSYFGSEFAAPFSDIWKAMGDVIKACRQKLGDVNMGSKLDKVRYCMTMVHYARQSDQAMSLINAINQSLHEGSLKFTIETKIVTAPNGATWSEIDPAATLRKCRGCTQQLHDWIVRYAAGYDTLNDNNRRHYRAIQAAQAEEGRVQRAPSC